MDIPGFLRRYAPFDDLAEDDLEAVVRATHIEFYPQGHVLLQQGGEPSHFLFVVRTGSVELVDGDDIVDTHDEGEVFGYLSLLTGFGPAFTVRAHEDAICYLVEHGVAERVFATHRGLAFLSRSLRSREQRALEGGQTGQPGDPWTLPVESLVRSAPLSVRATASIREAATLMADRRVSSVLIERDGDWGILTDRDLRSRVVAAGRDPDEPVDGVDSSPLIGIERGATAGETLVVMLEGGIHHVPVLDPGGGILGVVTDTDLLAVERRAAFRLRGAIERAADAHEAVERARTLPATVVELVDASVDPLEIGHFVAATVDALTERLAQLAIDRLGEPPCAWSWLSLGSEARREQGLATDQDNALVYDVRTSDLDIADAFFGEMAVAVNEGLADAGIPRCRAGVMASNREWRGSIEEWEERFRGWIDDPGRSGSAFSGIAFDCRPVAGPLDVRSRLDPVIRDAGRDREFLRHLGHRAVAARPPSGFLKAGVVEAQGTNVVTLDVKRVGISAITDLARIYAYQAGIVDENRTVRRLRGSGRGGGLSAEVAQGLEEAFRLLFQVRIEHHAQRVRRGVPPDDEVDPRDLGPLTRQGLREAFRLIEQAQRSLAAELGLRA